MNFKYLALIRITSTTLAGSVAIVMAFYGFGVWSLAAQSLLGTATSTVARWYMSEWRPSFVFEWKAVRGLLGFSTNHFAFTFLNYFTRNADQLLIGRFLGAEPLGFYSRAQSLMLMPLRNVWLIVGQVMFPALSSIQKDRKLVGQVYLRMTSSIALVSFPAMLGLLVVSEKFVVGVFGSQWTEITPLVQLFCIVAMIQSIGTLNGQVYLSQGRADLQLKVSGTLNVLRVIVVAMGVPWGIEGVAWAYLIGVLLIVYPSIAVAVSLVNLRFRDVLANLAGIFGCAAVMAVVVWLVGTQIPKEWPELAFLGVQVPVGMAVYVLLLHSLKVRAYGQMCGLLKEQLQQRLQSAPVISTTVPPGS
jgi:PST family polysaccharide transporter